MARRAEKYKRLVWLKAMSSDPEEGRPIVAGSTPEKFEPFIGLLVGGYHLWIEIEKAGDSYILRCFPKPSGGGHHTPRICASYEGPSLGRILLVAAEDYREYVNAPHDGELSPFEVVRHVS